MTESDTLEPEKVQKIGAFLDRRFMPQEARAVRRLAMRKVVLSTDAPSPETREFVLSHMDLLAPEDFGTSLHEASRWLFRHCVPEAWRLLEAGHSASSFAQTFILEAQEAELVKALEADAHRTARVLEVRPGLVASKSFWQSGEHIVEEAVNHVCGTNQLSGEVPSAMLQAGGVGLARQLSKRLPVQALFSIPVSVSDRDPPDVRTETWSGWLSALMPDPITVARLLMEGRTRSFVTIARLAGTLSPASVPNELDRDLG